MHRGRPEQGDEDPDGNDLRKQRQRLFLHLRRGLDDRYRRPNERAPASIGKAIIAVVTSASRKSPSKRLHAVRVSSRRYERVTRLV